MSPAIKPRMMVGIKEILLILGFCGVGTMSGLYVGAQRILFFLLAGPFHSQSEADSIRTDRMIQKATIGPINDLRAHVDKRSDRIERALLLIPQVRRAYSDSDRVRLEAERQEIDRQRIFPTQ